MAGSSQHLTFKTDNCWIGLFQFLTIGCQQMPLEATQGRNASLGSVILGGICWNYVVLAGGVPRWAWRLLKWWRKASPTTPWLRGGSWWNTELTDVVVISLLVLWLVMPWLEKIHAHNSGDGFYFDAAAPIIDDNTIDMSRSISSLVMTKGGGLPQYSNDQARVYGFHEALVNAEEAQLIIWKRKKYFEGWHTYRSHGYAWH